MCEKRVQAMTKNKKPEKKEKAAKDQDALAGPQVIVEKPVNWIGTSLNDLAEFPLDVKRKLGMDLYHVQSGLDPVNWKPFPGVGPGTYELVTQDADGWYRVVYVGKFAEAVYVLHSFKKKTNATAKKDVELAQARYKQAMEQRKKAKK
jgi:phage-related protein